MRDGVPSRIWIRAMLGPHFFELKSPKAASVSFCLLFSIQGFINPSGTASAAMSLHPTVYTMLLPAPAGRVQGVGMQGQKQREPPSLGSLSGVLLGTGFNREQILVLSFVILVLSNVSSSLPSPVAQTLNSAHVLGHHPPPCFMLSLGPTAPAGSSAVT